MRTIATFTKPEDAHNLRAFFEGSGIRAFVRDEGVVGADPLISNAIGGVRVEVLESEFGLASSLYRTIKAPSSLPELSRHSKLRYLKIFVISFIGTFVLLLLRRSAFGHTELYGAPLLLAAGASILIASCCAMLNV